MVHFELLNFWEIVNADFYSDQLELKAVKIAEKHPVLILTGRMIPA